MRFCSEAKHKHGLSLTNELIYPAMLLVYLLSVSIHQGLHFRGFYEVTWFSTVCTWGAQLSLVPAHPLFCNDLLQVCDE